MKDECSIEQHIEKIFDSRSKDYFSEVMSCYNAGNYRSAVVMLWSVVICDILFKLEHLSESHGDKKAEEILAEINKLWKANERSSEWELKLVKLVEEQTQLINIAELDSLRHLQRQRHLAAHPVVGDNFQLYRPNRDNVRAMIRSALDGLLTKAPILPKGVVHDLVEDLERESEILFDENKLKAYLESKYFSRFNSSIEKEVFKALWKFVFRSDDERCDKNRAINYSALNLLYSRNPSQFKLQITENKDYFSAISSSGLPLMYLVKFLSRWDGVYLLLAEHAKTAIQHMVEQEASARCLAWFIAPSLKDHAASLHTWIVGNCNAKIERETWGALREISDSPEWGKNVLSLVIAYYVASPSFNEADARFDEAIRPMLPEFDIEDFERLFGDIEGNSQTWGRKKAKKDHLELYDHARTIDPGFDLTKFRNVWTALRKV